MDALKLLLGDFDRTDFFNNYWEKKSLYLQHNDNRFKDFINMKDMEEQVEKCAVSKIMYRDDEGKIRESIVTDKKDFKGGKDPNLTMCTTYLEKIGPRKDFLESFHSQVRSLPDYYFNCYYSPTEHGYGMHMDPHPVWILQVEGRKKWEVAHESVCESPQHSFIMQPDKEAVKLPWGYFERPKPEELFTVVLEPGDVLYIPAGCFHEARAHDSHSLALTLAHARVTSFDIFAYLLQRVIGSYPDLMKRLPGAPVEEQRASADDQLLPKLDEAVGILREVFDKNLTAEKLQREYFMHIERKKNFPQFYEVAMKVPDKLEKDMDEKQAKAAGVRKA